MKAIFIKRARWFTFFLITTILLALSPVVPVYAAGIVVTTSIDTAANDGACSLREAVDNANNNAQTHPDCAGGAGQDTITFASGIATITLSSTLPSITDSNGLTIDGAGAVTIDGANSSRIFTLNNGATLTLSSLVLSHGNAGGNYGGAVYSQGNLIVNNSRFTGNTAQFGGAILSLGGSTSINTSTFSQNSSLEGGGAVLVTSSGAHSISNSLFAGNVAYNAINEHGSGGGIQTENGTTVTITNVTLVNNSAGGSNDDGGGGLMVYGGAVTIVNSTISSNSTTTQGGGIRQLGGTVTLRNTILADNSSGGNCAGSITDGSGNLVWGDATCPGVSADPHLVALAANGGSTQSMALGAGSAAIDLAASAYCPLTDQRGLPRRTGFCDAGAFEAQPTTVTTTSGTPQQAVTLHSFPDPLVVSVYDSYSNTLGGVPVSFNAPSSGASAALSSATTTTSSGGTASVAATANNQAGTYLITTTVSGAAAPALFDLTNANISVTSILRADTNPTNSSSVHYSVTFNVPVTGVDASDFSLTVSGVSGAAVSSISGSDATYTATIDTGNGDGTLRLDVVDDDTILDSFGQPLGGPGVGNGDGTDGEVYTIDKTPPETSLISTPINPSNQADASFSFSSPDGSATFECNLDDAGFTTCSNPASYSSLAEGSHSFQVRAKDAAGNVDPTPATFSWTIDVTPPDTTITSAPSDPTNSAQASFDFSSADGTATFECNLDDAGFTTCSSPASYTSLAEGNHSFQVRAKDPAGNVDLTPAGYSWTVDPRWPSRLPALLRTRPIKPLLPSPIQSAMGVVQGLKALIVGSIAIRLLIVIRVLMRLPWERALIHFI
jgi:CSLREA domain-containing protein